MKNRIITYLIIALPLTASCDRFGVREHVFENSVYLNVSEYKSVQPATFSNKVDEVTRELSVVLAYPADTDISATVEPDMSLVAEYNRKYGTDYDFIPSQYLDFESATVSLPAGHTESETIGIRFRGLTGKGEEQQGAMEIDKTYLLPVRIVCSDMKIMSGSDVAYYIVRRSSAITTAAQLTDNWISFPGMDMPGSIADAYNGLTAVTYEALIYIDRFDSSNSFGECNISTIMGVEQYLLLRIGDASFERQQIQFDGSGSGSAFGKFPARDAAKKLYDGQWYHVACTYDQNTRTARIYVDGKIQSEGKDMGVTAPSADNGINLAQRALGSEEAYQFFIAKSYNDYRPLQGRIAEARVWSVARTPEQIWENMYKIDNPEELPELLGYWKFDEGKGNTIKDWSMYGNDGVAENDIIWPDGIEIPVINKEED